MLVGQFTYATVAEPGPYSDVDGWKVKQVLPDVGNPGSPTQSWVEKATATLGSFAANPLPLLASQAEIDALPRRMRLEPFAGGFAVLLNQQSAGQSHHHRESSFTHAFLVKVERGLGVDDLRPADLWGASVWLRPSGADEVRDAKLTPDVRLVASGRLPTVDDLWGSEREVALLLLAVMESALAGRGDQVTRIALLDDGGSRTAAWVAFLSKHLTPGAAWLALPFSTFERSENASASGLADMRVVGIPAQDAASAAGFGPDWLVLDPANPPPLITAGDRPGWRLPGDREVLIGAWTRLAEGLTFLEEMGMASLAELVDELGRWCEGSADAKPLWAVPAALLMANEEVQRATANLAASTAELAVDNWPAGLSLPLERHRALVEVIARVHPEPVKAFRLILAAADKQLPDGPGNSDLALEGYLKALWGKGTGSAWVRGSGPLPWLPKHVRPTEMLAASLAAEVNGLVDWVWGSQSGQPDASGRADLSGRADASGRADLSGRADASGRADLSGRADASGRADLSGQPDRSGRVDLSGRADASGRADLSGQPDRSGRVDASGQADLSGRADLEAVVRLLSSVTGLFDRWGLSGALFPVVIPRLVEALTSALLTRRPVVDGSWPKVSNPIFAQISALLEEQLARNPILDLGSSVAAWLDLCGPPLDADIIRHPLQQWTYLELERALYSPLTIGNEPSAITVRAAGLVRRSIREQRQRLWNAQQWLDEMAGVFGPINSLAPPITLLVALVDREIPVPALEIGERLLSVLGLSYGRDAPQLARWLSSSPVTESSSLMPFRQPLEAFTAVNLHAGVAVDPPSSGDVSEQLYFRNELSTLFTFAGRAQGVLREESLTRFAADILAVDCNYVARIDWPWPSDQPDQVVDRGLLDYWQMGFGALEAASVDRHHRRLALAASLLVRAFVYEEAVKEAAGRRYRDPAGPWLVHRVEGTEWQVESLVKELLKNCDRSQRQAWITDLSELARRMITEFGRQARDSYRSGGSGFAGLQGRVIEMIETNAPEIAFGVLGAKFVRKPGKRGDDFGQPGFPVGSGPGGRGSSGFGPDGSGSGGFSPAGVPPQLPNSVPPGGYPPRGQPPVSQPPGVQPPPQWQGFPS